MTEQKRAVNPRITSTRASVTVGDVAWTRGYPGFFRTTWPFTWIVAPVDNGKWRDQAPCWRLKLFYDGKCISWANLRVRELSNGRGDVLELGDPGAETEAVAQAESMISFLGLEGFIKVFSA